MNFIKNLLYGNKINELMKHAQDHFEDENYFAAITFYSHILNFDKRNLIAHYERGKTYLIVKNFPSFEDESIYKGKRVYF